jgi:hypothetical protein
VFEAFKELTIGEEDVDVPECKLKEEIVPQREAIPNA